MNEKYSARREQIYDFLAGTTSHPRAEEVYLALKPTNPSLSLATVYRNLSKFVSEGKAISIPGANHAIHFDANVKNHYHFSCQKCGRIYDVDLPVVQLDLNILSHLGRVDRHELVFHGICNDCQK